MTRRGLRDVTFVPWGFFEGKDGWVCIMCGNESMWAPLARAMERSDMIEDPRYDTFDHRYENRDEVYRIVEEWVHGLDSVDRVVELMAEAGVPCDRVNTVEQALAHPQVSARELLVEKTHPTLGPMKIVGSGLHLSETRTDPPGEAPFLGQHNREVLIEVLGRSSDEVDQLVESGVLYEDPRLQQLVRE